MHPRLCVNTHVFALPRELVGVAHCATGLINQLLLGGPNVNTVAFVSSRQKLAVFPVTLGPSPTSSQQMAHNAKGRPVTDDPVGCCLQGWPGVTSPFNPALRPACSHLRSHRLITVRFCQSVLVSQQANSVIMPLNNNNNKRKRKKKKKNISNVYSFLGHSKSLRIVVNGCQFNVRHFPHPKLDIKLREQGKKINMRHFFFYF